MPTVWPINIVRKGLRNIKNTLEYGFKQLGETVISS